MPAAFAHARIDAQSRGRAPRRSTSAIVSALRRPRGPDDGVAARPGGRASSRLRERFALPVPRRLEEPEQVGRADRRAVEALPARARRRGRRRRDRPLMAVVALREDDLRGRRGRAEVRLVDGGPPAALVEMAGERLAFQVRKRLARLEVVRQRARRAGRPDRAEHAERVARGQVPGRERLHQQRGVALDERGLRSVGILAALRRPVGVRVAGQAEPLVGQRMLQLVRERHALEGIQRLLRVGEDDELLRPRVVVAGDLGGELVARAACSGRCPAGSRRAP